MKWTSALLATVAGVAMAAGAQAADEGFYIGAGLGVHFPEHDIIGAHVPPTAASVPADVHFDTGWIGDVAAGYKFPSGFRTEFDVTYRTATIDTIDGDKFAGRQNALGLTGNLLYDFNSGGSLQPYIGAGLGLGRDYWRRVRGPGSPTFTDSDAAFQWQAIGGVSAALSRNVDMYVEYRYIHLASTQFDGVTPT